MSANDLIALLGTRPFVPFRIFASEGRTHDVHHPDQALVGLIHVNLPLPAPGGIPERFERLALRHIVRVEDLPTLRHRGMAK